MLGEIIAIGDELTTGRIVNTNSVFAARQLFAAGYDIHAMHTVGDEPEIIGEALLRALKRVDFVIVTGGLGATDDDLTNEAVSIALNRPALPNLRILSLVRDAMNSLEPLSARKCNQFEKLAWLPEGAQALNPEAGMAGYLLEHDHKPIFFLPGVPTQMRHLMTEHVLPRLSTWNSGRALSTRQKLFKIFNLSEMEVNNRIASLTLDDRVHIGYYPVFPEVHLNLTVREHSVTKLEEIFTSSCDLVTKALSPSLYGFDRETMELIVGRLLIEKGLTLAAAESCTGGLISHRLTTIPGSSKYFLGGVTAYCNSVKETFLHVDASILLKYGAVSNQVAKLMADGIKKHTGADIGLSVTGIAGPGGGSDQKPVGTVFIGLATSQQTRVEEFHFSGERQQIQEITAQTGLDLVREYLLDTTLA